MVHRHTRAESRAKEAAQLSSQVEHEFDLYQRDTFIVSPQFAYLFTKKTKRMDRDAISSWLRTVAETKRHQMIF